MLFKPLNYFTCVVFFFNDINFEIFRKPKLSLKKQEPYAVGFILQKPPRDRRTEWKWTMKN